jgi:tryptophan synthase alpha chain
MIQTMLHTNRLAETFAQHTRSILSIYFTAGYPSLHDTVSIIRILQAQGVDMIEIGIPFSDPVADGPVIQQSSECALRNGMTLSLLFEQLQDIRTTVDIPLILMGYCNTMLQYGVEAFLQKCVAIGIDGVILPDLPLEVFQDEYAELFTRYGIAMIFLIAPQTSPERIRSIDAVSTGFLYAVSSSAITGSALSANAERTAYLQRLKDMQLRNPLMVGFGIHDKESFDDVCQYAHGGIIGTAFINALQSSDTIEQDVTEFVHTIRGSVASTSNI